MRLHLVTRNLLFAAASLLLSRCTQPAPETSSYQEDYTTAQGKAVSVMLTAYSTTLIANGKDKTGLHVALTDSLNRQILSATDTVRIYVNGGGTLTDANGKELTMKPDTANVRYAECVLTHGTYDLAFVAGTQPGKTQVEARSGKLWPGGHEIHMFPSDFRNLTPTPDQLPPTSKTIPPMIGADISFLPQIENQWHRKFTENGQEVDAIALLHDHGFNFIRLRIFVNPENEKGYSPETGYCGLDSTLSMARRTKEAGMKLLLDFHYSDYWADPQQQNKPLAWKDLDFATLQDSVRAYTAKTLNTFKAHGVLPDMVQVGNEINHGMLWPDGHIGNPDQLAALLKAGVTGIRDVDTTLPIMMHIALGGQNDEAVFWLNNMLARGVQFDVIGLSYYPRWHGTLDDLNNNLHDLLKRYHKPLFVVEYGDFKQQVHDIVFALPDSMGKGACIWEPLGPRSGLFTRDGETTEMMNIYDSLSKTYLR